MNYTAIYFAIGATLTALGFLIRGSDQILKDLESPPGFEAFYLFGGMLFCTLMWPVLLAALAKDLFLMIIRTRIRFEFNRNGRGVVFDFKRKPEEAEGE